MRRLSILIALVACVTSYARTIEVDSLHTSQGIYSDLADLIKGQVAGVRSSSINDEDLRIDIRGLNTLRANTFPLLIVDGAIMSNAPAQMVQPFFQYGDSGYLSMSGGISGLNIYDIESVEILKNTSATAIYGSKGANGVILIKTRQSDRDKMSIDVNSNLGLRISEVTAEGITPAIQHYHNLAIGSKGKSSHFRLSAFFRDTDGVYAGTGSESYGARATFGANRTDKMVFGGTFSLYMNQTKTPSSTAWYGAPSLTLTSRKIYPFSYNDPSRINSIEGWLADYDNHANNFRTTDNVYLNLKLAPGFFWKNNVGVDFQQNTRNIWYGNGTTFGNANNGAAAILNTSLLNLNASSAFEFSRYINSVNNISASLAFEFITQQNKYNSMTGTDFFSHELRAKGLTLMESKAVVRHFTTSFLNPAASLNLHYDYKSLVGADIHARYDTYLEYDRNSDFIDSFYPAVNVYADLKGLLMSDSTVLSGLRIEGGYGVSGTRQLLPYNTFGLYSTGGYPIVSDEIQAYYKGMNRVICSEYNATVKASFMNDKLSVAATYYDRTIDDSMSIYCSGKQKSENVTTWISTPMTVAAAYNSRILNRGVELELGGTPLRNSRSELEMRITAAYNFNNLTAVDSADEKGLYLNSYNMYATVNQKGYPVSSIYGYTLDNDNVVNGEGIIGTTIPTITGGFDIRYRIGDFHISALADWAAGHDILNMNRMLASGQEYVSEAFVEKGDYLRLARVSASYDFNFSKKHIRSLSISLSANNLLTATSYSGWNPDVNSFGYTNLSYGLDYGSCPMVRNIVLGIAVKF